MDFAYLKKVRRTNFNEYIKPISRTCTDQVPHERSKSPTILPEALQGVTQAEGMTRMSLAD
jgi:hypothetical protein